MRNRDPQGREVARPMSDDHQQRRHPRLELALSVTLSSIDPECDPRSGQPFFRSVQETCANLSRGGAFVRTSEGFEPGRRLLLEFDLPDGHQLEALGRVAWTKRDLAREEACSEEGIGIEFMGGASRQWRALDTLLEERFMEIGPKDD